MSTTDETKCTVTIHAPELGTDGYNFNIDRNIWNVLHSLPESGRDSVIKLAWRRVNDDLFALYADAPEMSTVIDCGPARSDLFERQLKVVLFSLGLGDEPPLTLLTDWIGEWYVNGMCRNGCSNEEAIAAYAECLGLVDEDDE